MTQYTGSWGASMSLVVGCVRLWKWWPTRRKADQSFPLHSRATLKRYFQQDRGWKKHVIVSWGSQCCEEPSISVALFGSCTSRAYHQWPHPHPHTWLLVQILLRQVDEPDVLRGTLRMNYCSLWHYHVKDERGHSAKRFCTDIQYSIDMGIGWTPLSIPTSIWASKRGNGRYTPRWKWFLYVGVRSMLGYKRTAAEKVYID